jgi:trimeric autotransporter adhesin
MRAANTRPTLAFAITLAVILGASGTYGCFGGRSLTDPSSGNPGTGFRPPTSQIAQVTLSPSSISGRPGDSTTITATLKDSSGAVVTDSAVDWSSTDSSVATVSASGRVRLWHKGRSWIHIRVGGASDSVPTTVTNPVLATIQLSPTSISGVPGTSTQIAAVLEDSTGAPMTPPPTLNWTSSNSSIASVSASGLVSLSKQGNATITASASGVSSTVAVAVSAPPVGPVASIALSPGAITGIPGNTAQMSAVLTDASGNIVTGVTVSWSSSNTAVATVSSGGLVALVKQGAATIKASAGGVSATIGATVNAAPVASIALSPASITGVAGNTMQVSAVLKDASGNTVAGQTVSWASSDATIANVSSSGLVTLKKQGSTTITASDGSISATVAVTVNATPVAAIALSPTTVTGVPGNTAQLSAVPEDASGNAMSGVSLTWTSSNTAIATVSSGTVTLVKQGTATITVAGAGVVATAAVTVNAPAVAAITLSPASVTGVPGNTKQLAAAAQDASGNAISGATVTWSSSSPATATVSSSGLVTLVKPGTATITAASGTVTATAAVTVNAPAVAAIALSPASVTGVPGNSKQLTATAQDASGNTMSGATVTWSSSSSATATVSSSGMVTLVKQGTATITAASGSVTATAAVTVNAAAPPAVASVSVAPATTSVVAGKSVQLAVTAKDASGNVITGAAITWSSSSTGVATVSGTGLVQALAAGTVIISATSGGHVATANVTVTAASSGGAGSGSANEPAGMSAQYSTGAISSFAQTGMTMISPATWSAPYQNGEAANLGTVPDGTGLRVTYPPTLPGGYSPVRFMTSGFANQGTGWLYIRMKIRFSPNWTTNGNVDVKLAEPHTLYEDNENDNIDAWVTGSQSVLITGLQGPSADRNLQPNTGAGVITGGAWHTMELLYGPESTSGAGNGTYQAWVDGVQVANYSNVNWLAAGETPGWHELLFDPCYGGGTSNPPSSSPNIYWDFDQLYISTK